MGKNIKNISFNSVQKNIYINYYKIIRKWSKIKAVELRGKCEFLCKFAVNTKKYLASSLPLPSPPHFSLSSFFLSFLPFFPPVLVCSFILSISNIKAQEVIIFQD